jgi:O-antigen ligase
MEAFGLSPAARLSVRFRWPEFAGALLVSLAAGYVLTQSGDWKIAVGLIAAAGLLVLGLLAPAIFVSVFLVLRPLTDHMAEDKLVGGVNAASMLALLVIAIGLVAVAARREGVAAMSGVANSFGAVLVVSALAAVPALINYGDQLGIDPVAELARLASLFAIFLLARQLFRSTDQMRRLFVLVALSAVIPAVVGLYQWTQGIKPVEDLGFGRLESTFVGPNSFGVHLAVAALILIALPRDALSRRIRVAALIPILLALFETYSRAGWATLAIGLILLGLRQQKFVIVTAAIAVALLVVNVPRFSERVLPNTAEGGSEAALTWRANNWDKLLGKYAEKPATGYGLRSSEAVNPNRTSNQRGLATEENPSGLGGAGPHSAVVKLLVEGGPLLLGAWVALFVALVGGIRRIGAKRPELRRYGQILFALWVTLAIEGAVSHDALNLTATLFALFALTGAAAGASAVAGQEEPAPKPA